MSIRFCPRCGEKTYEVLQSHSYCINCSYFPEDVERDRVNEEICAATTMPAKIKDDLARWSKALAAVM
ncbi:MAG: hypothetical protein HYX41_06985 [Bdellovibrio sp.]|nr:hypothetical protein [Bdellovibrio sp.]